MKSDRRDPASIRETPLQPAIGRRELLSGTAATTAVAALGLLAGGPTPVNAARSIPVQASSSPLDPAIVTLVADIRFGDNNARQTAVRLARLVGTSAIGPLGTIHGGGDPNASKAALEAIRRIVHNAARPGAQKERESAAGQLLALTAGTHAQQTRGEAVRLLGYVGGPTESAALADLLHVPSLREDARMALERMPDPGAEAALKRAARTVPPDYRGAIAQSLRARRLKPGQLGIKA